MLMVGLFRKSDGVKIEKDFDVYKKSQHTFTHHEWVCYCRFIHSEAATLN